MLAQTYPKYLSAEKTWPLGNLYAVTQGASSTPTIRYAHAYNLSLCTVIEEVSAVTAGLHGVHPAWQLQEMWSTFIQDKSRWQLPLPCLGSCV